jgi:hypothetical protein
VPQPSSVTKLAYGQKVAMSSANSDPRWRQPRGTARVARQGSVDHQGSSRARDAVQKQLERAESAGSCADARRWVVALRLVCSDSSRLAASGRSYLTMGDAGSVSIR